MIIASNFQFHPHKTSYSVYADIKGLFFSVEPLRPTFWKWSSPYNGNFLNNDELLTNAIFQQCPRLKSNTHLTTPTPLWRQPFHNVSVTWMRPDSWFKNPTDGGVTRCVFKDNKILSPWSQFFWSMWRIKNAEVEHGLQIKYEKYRILWLKIVTLLVLRCFLQAFCINLTALFCQEKSRYYILISNYILMIIVNPFPW